MPPPSSSSSPRSSSSLPSSTLPVIALTSVVAVGIVVGTLAWDNLANKGTLTRGIFAPSSSASSNALAERARRTARNESERVAARLAKLEAKKRRNLDYFRISLVPQGHRWLRLVGIQDTTGGETSVVDSLVRGNRCSRETVEQIERDIPRTFPHNEYFDDAQVQASMRRVLIAVSASFPEIAYVQSMNFLAGFLLLHCKTEDATFALLHHMMSNPTLRLKDMYSPGLPLLFTLAGAVKTLIAMKFPAVSRHLAAIDLEEPLLWCQSALMTLFTFTMDYEVCEATMDVLLARGWPAVVRILLRAVELERETLMEADFEGAILLLKGRIEFDLNKEIVNSAQSEGFLTNEEDAALRRAMLLQ